MIEIKFIANNLPSQPNHGASNIEIPTCDGGARVDGLISTAEPEVGVMGTSLEGVAVGDSSRTSRARRGEGCKRSNRVEIVLREQVRGIIRDVVISDAAVPLVRARDHRGDELVVLLDVKEGAEVDERDEVLDGRIRVGGGSGGGGGSRGRAGGELLGEGGGERGAEAFELLDLGDDDGLGAEHLFLLAVERLAGGHRLLHLRDAVQLLPQRAEALRDDAEHRPVGGLGSRRRRRGGGSGGGRGGRGGGHGGKARVLGAAIWGRNGARGKQGMEASARRIYGGGEGDERVGQIRKIG